MKYHTPEDYPDIDDNRIRKGDRVEIVRGPWAGESGVITHLRMAGEIAVQRDGAELKSMLDLVDDRNVRKIP